MSAALNYSTLTGSKARPKPLLHFQPADLNPSGTQASWVNRGTLGPAHNLTLGSRAAPHLVAGGGPSGLSSLQFSGAEILQTAANSPLVGGDYRTYFARIKLPGNSHPDGGYPIYGSGTGENGHTYFSGYVKFPYPYYGTGIIQTFNSTEIYGIPQGSWIVVGALVRQSHLGAGAEKLETASFCNTLPSYLSASNVPGEGDGQFYIDTRPAPITIGGSGYGGTLYYQLDEFRQYGALRDIHIQQILTEMLTF